MLYSFIWRFLGPVLATYLRFTPRYRSLIGRFHTPPQTSIAERPFVIHACSVGEVAVARTMATALRQRFPDLPLLVTVSTVTGRSLAEDRMADIPITWFPFDHPQSVSRFLTAARPRAVVLLETELWPNFLGAAAARSIPVAVINGRISDKALPKYTRHLSLVRPMLDQLALVCAQTPEHAQRFQELGAPADRIQVTGNIKFDGIRTAYDPSDVADLRSDFGFDPEDRVIIYGSLRHGDDANAAALWNTIAPQHPNLRMVVAPRHPESFDAVETAFAGAVTRRTAQRTGATTPHKVILLDTVGELAKLYSVADAAIIGGSFFPGVNGHNPMEPAALGVPTLFGPYMRNFADAADVLIAAGGAVQTDATNLAAALQTVLADPAAASAMGRRGQSALVAAQGALAKSIDALQRALGPSISN